MQLPLNCVALKMDHSSVFCFKLHTTSKSKIRYSWKPLKQLSIEYSNAKNNTEAKHNLIYFNEQILDICLLVSD